ADAEEGLAAAEDFLPQGLQKARGAQVLDAGTEGADPGQDDALGRAQLLGGAGQAHVGPDPVEGVLHRVQVPHAVVDDGDQALLRRPGARPSGTRRTVGSHRSMSGSGSPGSRAAGSTRQGLTAWDSAIRWNSSSSMPTYSRNRSRLAGRLP